MDINRDYLITSKSKHGGKRKKPVRVLIPHHNAGVATGLGLAKYMKSTDRQLSATYIIGQKGEIFQTLDESLEPYTTSNRAIDTEAITIEIANSTGSPKWEITKESFNALVDLSIDICKRYGIKSVSFTGNKNGNIHLHKWYASTNCPGPYVESLMPEYARRVNAGLNAPITQHPSPTSKTLYRVQTGAYTIKSNADRLMEQVKKAGFATCMVQDVGLYKVQVGAYEKKSNANAMAKQLRAKGFPTYITVKGGKPASSTPKKVIKIGSKVRVKTGAKTYTGGNLSSAVFKNTYDVIEMKGDRVVIGIGKAITAPININDLLLV